VICIKRFNDSFSKFCNRSSYFNTSLRFLYFDRSIESGVNVCSPHISRTPDKTA
jgi:hypothetical protein